MKKKVENMEINGIPVRVSVMDRNDPENDTCWVTFDLLDAKFEGTLFECIISLEQAAKRIAKERGFLYLTSFGWDHHDIFSYRCEFIKIDEE